ncbi:hypothetical protein A2154_05200 [Candidatus Gottesmanbacteria bacterium RBG_16_43_7]|uniref:AP2/ERF domain-containing protein n=1 Tax=Candidatus Gottesmanbacteria bacterium RBG_16_43_7 TaxID=1798373 RepID=A0A1F5Z930_9BACT|nr:MAG: hypothetical protein A2154_05200 [Candidatus Gottesmanbacteria bacterium RBG_16_43_7]
MKYINVARKYKTIVDDEEFEYLNTYKWTLKKGYAVAKLCNRSGFLMMHKFIVFYPKSLTIDHINRNKLDNRKSNLRVCTQLQNNFNKPRQRNNESGYKGVCWDKKAQKWRAAISVNRRYFWLGYYDSKNQAAMAYNLAAKKHHREFACLNEIPQRNYALPS